MKSLFTTIIKNYVYGSWFFLSLRGQEVHLKYLEIIHIYVTNSLGILKYVNLGLKVSYVS